MPAVYTVGHSNHSLETFLELLTPHGIGLVADVRSQPHSRFNPQYNRERLAASLAVAGIDYAFLGAELGARSNDPACYVGDRADYELITRTPAFARGIAHVAAEAERRNVALLCAEKDPLDCHRTILVCPALAAQNVGARHIHADGSLEHGADFDERLIGAMGLGAPDLFRDHANLVGAAYRRRGLVTAFRRKAR